ncbi:cerebellin 18 [Lepisosteus oculatus]|uniref:Cerebellin 18 n=1 Tax=Lepisosteus oculatus TaxID=7918 RepID=W5MGY4_LEPOC|nr:PREDICTED: cerebellin-1-like [Lepisosteus oculatus]
MKTAAALAVCLWGALSLCVSAQSSTWSLMQEAAVSWTGDLPCAGWDCKCAFSRQRGCCCVASRYNALEESLFTKFGDLFTALGKLKADINEVTGDVKVAFTAAMDSSAGCYGPFTSSMPIPYNTVLINQGQGYNPALGAFTAPRTGLYSFSFSAYSNVGAAGNRLYHQVSLIRNSDVVASVWEDNREDSEDSGSQTVLLPLAAGDQVYIRLLSGRQLCGDTNQHNTFSGFLVYPTLQN